MRWARLFVLCVVLSAGALILPGRPVAAQAAPVKQLNFVFIHGAGSTAAAIQRLSDDVEDQVQEYIAGYQQASPGVRVRVNTLLRSYPNDVDVVTWAENLAGDIAKHFAGKQDLVLVGHSMGGKAALYAVAHNTGGLGDNTSAVITINSPVKALNSFYVFGGGGASNYCRLGLLLDEHGLCGSVGGYDSSADGLWVAQNRHWLALISGEPAPLSPMFDKGTALDGWPRDIDDGLVPTQAQYSTGADVVYYGIHEHSEFQNSGPLSRQLARQILDYVFGRPVDCAVPGPSGDFKHRAGFLPFAYHWQDQLVDAPGPSGQVSHRNGSLFRWQSWQDAIGACAPGTVRSRFEVKHTGGLPLWTSVRAIDWAAPNDPLDCRLLVRSSAGPLATVRLQWTVFDYAPVPPGSRRAYYDIVVLAGTSLSGVTDASWTTADPSDPRINASSRVEGPFRWLEARWRIFITETRVRDIIGGIPVRPAP